MMHITVGQIEIRIEGETENCLASLRDAIDMIAGFAGSLRTPRGAGGPADPESAPEPQEADPSTDPATGPATGPATEPTRPATKTTRPAAPSATEPSATDRSAADDDGANDVAVPAHRSSAPRPRTELLEDLAAIIPNVGQTVQVNQFIRADSERAKLKAMIDKHDRDKRFRWIRGISGGARPARIRREQP